MRKQCRFSSTGAPGDRTHADSGNVVERLIRLFKFCCAFARASVSPATASVIAAYPVEFALPMDPSAFYCDFR